MLIDTHAHLDYPNFESDVEDVLHRAEGARVHRNLGDQQPASSRIG